MGLLISERTYTVISRTYTQSESATPKGRPVRLLISERTYTVICRTYTQTVSAILLLIQSH